MSDAALRSRLRNWRQQKCAEKGWGDKVYLIFKNDTLNDLVARRTATNRDLLNVTGLGPHKVDEYGAELLRIINPGAAVPVAAKLPEAKSHAGAYWSPEDIGDLCQMHSRGDTVKAMAAQLGRSDLAVRMKLDALGLQQHPVPPPAPAAHAPLPAPVPAALPAPAPAALPAPSTAAAKAPHAGSKRKVEDEEEDEASTGKEQQGAPAPSTPAKKRETTLA